MGVSQSVPTDIKYASQCLVTLFGKNDELWVFSKIENITKIKTRRKDVIHCP